MNGIEKITARIEADARSEASVILDEARAEAERIKADFDTKAQERYWELVRAGVKEAELRVQRLDSTARMEAKKSILAMKQEMVASAFDRARELMNGFSEDKYVDFLARLAAKAARTGTEELIFNERDNAGAAKAAVKLANTLLKERGIAGKLTVSQITRPILGGLIVKDGDIEVNCSIETLTELYRNELSTQVAEAMFD